LSVSTFKASDDCKEDKLPVAAFLSHRSLGYGSRTVKTFGFDPNHCNNHITGVPAANRSRQKYFKAREVYNAFAVAWSASEESSLMQ
jgi:hypothetical protein